MPNDIPYKLYAVNILVKIVSWSNGTSIEFLCCMCVEHVPLMHEKDVGVIVNAYIWFRQ